MLLSLRSFIRWGKTFWSVPDTLTITDPDSSSTATGSVVVRGTSVQYVNNQALPAQSYSFSVDVSGYSNGYLLTIPVSNWNQDTSVSVLVVNYTESSDGDNIPDQTQLVDANGDIWTLVGGVAKKNGVNAGFTTGVVLLFYWEHQVYQENGSSLFWYWNGTTWVSTGDPRPVAKAYFWGVNGHMAYPLGTGSSHNQTSPSVQLAELLDLGCRVYRADVAGLAQASQLAVNMVGFRSAGVEILPVLQVISNGWHPSLSAVLAYNIGYSLGFATANRLRGMVDWIECGNELDGYNVSGSYTMKVGHFGNLVSDWSIPLWPSYREVQRGMVNGVRDASASIKVMLNIGISLAYTALQMLWNGMDPTGSVNPAVAIKFDAPSYHWYHSSGSIFSAGTAGNINVLQILRDGFSASGSGNVQMPIWLTEVGWSGGGDANTSASSSASNYMRVALAGYEAGRSAYGIASVQWYTLQDAAYGLYSLNGVTATPAKTTYKDFISSHPVNV